MLILYSTEDGKSQTQLRAQDEAELKELKALEDKLKHRPSS